MAFSLILLLFCYFRLKPIINQTIPYTFDQGRDFMKAREIVKERNITFIGPEAGGLQGVFHGAWWYYFLTIPFILTGGNPNAFIYYLFTISLVSGVAFSYFLKKSFNIETALFFFLVLAISPYFIGISFFAINSGMTLPFILLFFYTSFYFLKTKKPIFLFLILLSLGFIFEAELPFGIFLIPAFFITVILLRKFKMFFGSLKNIGISISGLIIPLSLRILFEIKNGFNQTQILLSALFNRSLQNKKTFLEIFHERFDLFINFYYFHIFPQASKIIGILVGILIVAGIFFGYKKLDKLEKLYFKYVALILGMIFFLSLVYRETFYANYLEGIPYFFLLIITMTFYMLSKKIKSQLLINIPLSLFLILGLFLLYLELKAPAPKMGGLREHVLSLEHIYKREGKSDFCTRIYTPPVIPHTYNYLFSYYSDLGYKQPEYRFVRSRCWYIIENEPYAFRLTKWRKENIPTKAKLKSKKNISDNISLELWEIK